MTLLAFKTFVMPTLSSVNTTHLMYCSIKVMTKSSQESIITQRKELNMNNCDYCKKEIPALVAGRQWGKLFVHQVCYDLIADELESILFRKLSEVITKEKIELEAGGVGPLGEIIIGPSGKAMLIANQS